MTDLNIKNFIARTVPNKLSLAETLDKMKSLYKSIAFESQIVNGEFAVAFDEKGRETRKDLLNYYFADLYYYQTCIDYGNYKEVDNYAG